MGWTVLDAKTIDKAILELQLGDIRMESTRGVLDPTNIWSVAGPGWRTAGPLRIGGVVLDILAPVRSGDENDDRVLHKCVGHVPNVFDVPDAVLIEHSYDFRATQDLEYAEWLAKVFYARSLMRGTISEVGDLFGVSFSEFKKKFVDGIDGLL